MSLPNHLRSVLAGRVLSEIGRRSEDSCEERMVAGPRVHPCAAIMRDLRKGHTTKITWAATCVTFCSERFLVTYRTIRTMQANGTALCYWC